MSSALARNGSPHTVAKVTGKVLDGLESKALGSPAPALPASGVDLSKLLVFLASNFLSDKTR